MKDIHDFKKRIKDMCKLKEKGLITWEGLNENNSNKKYKLK